MGNMLVWIWSSNRRETPEEDVSPRSSSPQPRARPWLQTIEEVETDTSSEEDAYIEM